MNRIYDPEFWRHYQGQVADNLMEMLHDPDSDAEWIETSLNVLWLEEEIIEGLEPPP